MTVTTILVLTGASGGSFDPDALHTLLYTDATHSFEHVVEVSNADDLAAATREAIEQTEEEVVILWMGDVDRWAHEVDGVSIDDFWSPDARTDRLTILEVDSSYTIVEGLVILPAGGSGVRLSPPPLQQIGPWVDVFWVPDAASGGIVFSTSSALLPSDHWTANGGHSIPLVKATGVWQLSLEDSGGNLIGDMISLLPNAAIDGFPIQSMNGFAAGHEYWRWDSGVFPSDFTMRPAMLAGATKVGGPWEAHPYVDFSASPPWGHGSAAQWYRAENGGGAMDLWLGRTHLHTGSPVSPRSHGAPINTNDVEEVTWAADPSALVGGRVNVLPQDPVRFSASGPPPYAMVLQTWNTSSLP